MMESCQMSAKIMCTAHFYFAATITQDDDKNCTTTEWVMDAEESPGESGGIESKKFYQKLIFHSEFDCWWHRLLCFSFPNQMLWDDQFLQSGSISSRLWGRRQEEQEKKSGQNLHRPLLISLSDSDCLPPICRPFPRSTRSKRRWTRRGQVSQFTATRYVQAPWAIQQSAIIGLRQGFP